MKLITLNTHSITEPNYYEKMLILANAIATELPDVVALQEVNQTIDMPRIEGKTLVTSNADIRTDNYAEALLNELKSSVFRITACGCRLKSVTANMMRDWLF